MNQKFEEEIRKNSIKVWGAEIIGSLLTEFEYIWVDFGYFLIAWNFDLIAFTASTKCGKSMRKPIDFALKIAAKIDLRSFPGGHLKHPKPWKINPKAVLRHPGAPRDARRGWGSNPLFHFSAFWTILGSWKKSIKSDLKNARATTRRTIDSGLRSKSDLRLFWKNEKVTFDQFKGDILLIVNVASKCGFTKQYKALQHLQEKYESQGFRVLGFYCFRAL